MVPSEILLMSFAKLLGLIFESEISMLSLFKRAEISPTIKFALNFGSESSITDSKKSDRFLEFAIIVAVSYTHLRAHETV